MTLLGQLHRGRGAILGISLAAGCVACSGGGAGSGGPGTAGTSGTAGTTGIGGTAGTAGIGGTTGSAGTGGGAGTTGTGGIAGTGIGGSRAGTTGTAGTAGSAGAGGVGGTGAGAGTGGRPAGSCTFDVQQAPSPAIGTVQIVTWTLDVADLTDAHIDFGPAGATPTVTAPVDVRDPQHRTLLLGLKGAKPYTFRIVATAGAKTCTSADFSFTTGAVPSTAPAIVKTMPGTGAAKGFIVTTTGVDSFRVSTGQPNAFIFDTDGDIVWWSPTSLQDGNGISRAHMSWDGKRMWLMTTNLGNAGRTLSISMDGLTTTDHSASLQRAHHDLTVLPDGGIATMVHANSSTGSPDAIVEMKMDGTVTAIVPDLATLYPPTNTAFDPNAIHYYPADDSFTVGDRNGSLFVKFRHNGALVWQLGGANPVGKSFTLVGLSRWSINHGHHLTGDGRFLFFNNNITSSAGAPKIFELMLDETAGTATKTWEYTVGSGSAISLGDAERLPNGNALITNSNSGAMQEVDRSGKTVQTFTNTTFGYADFRTSLYGPPPR